jgi:hypothetical protein
VCLCVCVCACVSVQTYPYYTVKLSACQHPSELGASQSLRPAVTWPPQSRFGEKLPGGDVILAQPL